MQPLTIYDAIKRFARNLSAYNVEQITGDYDGSGDSGDMTVIFHVRIAAAQNPATGTRPGELKRYSEHSFLDFVKQQTPTPLFSDEDFSEFLDHIFALLPSGWEINDGSYGEINIDVVDNRITVAHNERYTDVRSSVDHF
jgi:hypothetical protein